MQKILPAAIYLLVAACLLTGCSESEEGLLTGENRQVILADRELMPNDQWQLSKERLQLSFCRNLTNEALMAERDELRRWRLSGEVTAFPEHRQRGLAALQAIYAEHNILLWQESGTVSSQFYRILNPQGYEASSIFSAVATLSRERDICFTGIDGIE